MTMLSQPNPQTKYAFHVRIEANEPVASELENVKTNPFSYAKKIAECINDGSCRITMTEFGRPVYKLDMTCFAAFDETVYICLPGDFKCKIENRGNIGNFNTFYTPLDNQTIDTQDIFLNDQLPNNVIKLDKLTKQYKGIDSKDEYPHNFVITTSEIYNRARNIISNQSLPLTKEHKIFSPRPYLRKRDEISFLRQNAELAQNMNSEDSLKETYAPKLETKRTHSLRFKFDANEKFISVAFFSNAELEEINQTARRALIEYVNSFKDKEPLATQCHELKIMEKSSLKEVIHRHFPNIPVRMDGKLYDLYDLVRASKNESGDRVLSNGETFKLTDIQPAFDVHNSMERLINEAKLEKKKEEKVLAVKF